MVTSRALRVLIAAVAALSVLGACAPEPHSALEPLRGPDDVDARPTNDSSADPSAGPVGLGDLSDEALDEVPPGFEQFGEVAFDDMELPPDDAPPPVEAGGGSPPAAGPPSDPSPPPVADNPPVTSPPPTTPIPVGGAGGVDAAADYCGLFKEYGTVMAAVDTALVSGNGQQITRAMNLAAQVHDKAAALDPSMGSDHRAVANGMRALEELLGEFGYDIGALVLTLDSDPGVAARFAATQIDAELDRTAQHVQNRCGVTMA